MSLHPLKEKKWEFRIAITGALVGGLIAVVSNLITVYASNAQKRNDERQALINKKIDLIDRTAKNFYRLPGTTEMIEYGMHRNIDTVFQNMANGRMSALPKDINVSKELAEIRAEFFSTLIQDQLYFGENVVKNIDSIFSENRKFQRSWWETPESLYINLLRVMVSDLNRIP